ncbi:hypothetical protein chiPu_0022814, partial [Chiloscyllium punctatum]|nr:hypothetical protein [Chiloscyllium punctatum]
MDSFRERKEQRLQAGADRSRAGGVDPEIRALVDTVNRSERFSTTSSCSGRVLLLAVRGAAGGGCSDRDGGGVG